MPPLPAPSWRQQLQALIRHPFYRRGVRELLPMLPGMAAWGLVTGVAMVKSGLGVGPALLMTFVVYAGSAQLAALPLMAAGAPMWVIWLTAFVVNLRFVIYSAQWRVVLGHLPLLPRTLIGYVAGDVNYAMFVKNWPEGRAEPGQLEYLAGGIVVMWTGWQVASVLGILLANQVPVHWGLGFAGTLALIGLMGSLLRDRATWVSAGVAGTAAIAAFALPYKLHIVVAVAAAVAAGLLMEGPGSGLGRPMRLLGARRHPTT
jgi:predicted branched-subunit amino acid permease